MKTLFLLIPAALSLTSGKSQNVGIGTDNPLFKLHVNGNSFATQVRGELGWFSNNIRVGTLFDNSYKLYVDAGNSYLGGDVTVTGKTKFTGNIGVGTDPDVSRKILAAGSIEATGFVYASSLSLSNSATIANNLYVNGTSNLAGLNVANDGIIDGNFRINGRIGINGATNGNYGLYVNNANSYFQGNTTTSGDATVSGHLSAGGGLSIKGSGHVRSAGNSSLEVGFTSKAINNTVAGGSTVELTVSLNEFNGGNNDIRVSICQFDPDPDPAFQFWRYFSFSIYDVDATSNTCRLVLYNHSSYSRVFKGTMYFMTVAKE